MKQTLSQLSTTAENSAYPPSGAGSAQSVGSAPVPLDTKERIEKAIQFLSSPSVVSAPTDRKISFLLSKGLTREEIDKAIATVASSGSVPAVLGDAPVSPPIPSRPPAQAVQAALHSVQPASASARTPLAFAVVMLVAFLGSSAFAFTYFKKWIRSIYSPFLSMYKKHVRDRLESSSSLVKQVAAYAGLYKAVAECEENDQNVIKAFKQVVYISNKDLARVSCQLSDAKASMTNSSLEALAAETQDLSKMIRESIYFPGELTYMVPSQVHSIKSEIRSLKGMILSRKNFPSTPPAYPPAP
ncbi:hypothetical protein HDV03_005558 [Kappamyces sp. JEL0829]|nr:hypothetical protein HDV03_005558 [Kappamyces sp. JEL0829]